MELIKASRWGILNGAMFRKQDGTYAIQNLEGLSFSDERAPLYAEPLIGLYYYYDTAVDLDNLETRGKADKCWEIIEKIINKIHHFDAEPIDVDSIQKIEIGAMQEYISPVFHSIMDYIPDKSKIVYIKEGDGPRDYAANIADHCDEDLLSILRSTDNKYIDCMFDTDIQSVQQFVVKTSCPPETIKRMSSVFHIFKEYIGKIEFLNCKENEKILGDGLYNVLKRVSKDFPLASEMMAFHDKMAKNYSYDSEAPVWDDVFCVDILRVSDIGMTKEEANLLSVLPPNPSLKFDKEPTGDFVYRKTMRQQIKIGKVLRKILLRMGIQIVDSHLEKMVNAIKADLIEGGVSLDIVDGEDIKTAYLDLNYHPDVELGTLNSSCHRQESKQKLLEMYVANPDKIKLIWARKDGKTIGRALLWLDCKFSFLKNRRPFMDRVYGSDAVIKMFTNFAKREGFCMKHTQSYNTPMDVVSYTGKKHSNSVIETPPMDNLSESMRVAYLDTMSYANARGVFCNHQKNDSFTKTFRDQNGSIFGELIIKEKV